VTSILATIRVLPWPLASPVNVNESPSWVQVGPLLKVQLRPSGRNHDPDQNVVVRILRMFVSCPPGYGWRLTEFHPSPSPMGAYGKILRPSSGQFRRMLRAASRPRSLRSGALAQRVHARRWLKSPLQQSPRIPAL
jgi:hypothetical protein